MSAESCREWRESLGAHALGRLPDEERAALEAHLDGCAACRAELASLAGVARLLPLADPAHFDQTPAPPPSLADRVVATIRSEHRASRRRRWRSGFALGGATAAVAAALLAFVVLPGGGDGSAPEQHVTFGSAPGATRVPALDEDLRDPTAAHLRHRDPHVREGRPLRHPLPRLPPRSRRQAHARRYLRYRWGEDSDAVLSAAMDLSRTRAIGVQVGRRTFIAPIGSGAAT